MIALSTIFLSPVTVNAANESRNTLTTCTSLKTGHTYISLLGKCNERVYEARTWHQKGSAPSGTPGSTMLDMNTCISKKTNVQIIRTRTACNSKIQTTAFWQRPVGPPVAPSITSVAMGLLGTASLTIAAPKTDGGSRVTSYIVTTSPGQVTATFKPDQIKAARISSLIPGNTYSFSVIAINGKGSSPASISSKPALAPIPIPVPAPVPRPVPVPVPVPVSEPVPVPTPTPTPTLRTISSPAIAGVTAPVTGARPVTTTTAGTGYTGTVTWSGTPRFFASVTTYTATITLTATSGYTLNGVTANFFTVAGATSVTHSANSGVITAVFPATSLSIPVFTLTSSSETRTVNSVATGFTVDSTGDAITSFSITPSAPAGMSFNTTTGEFTGTPTSIADAIDYTITATNAVGSATRTFTFTVTAPITISDAPIGGVAAPVTGSDPARTTTAGTGYTGTVIWSGSPKLFSADTTYTATITLTATSGYTLNGVTANFFTIAGATSVTHSANSGVITATFPATAKLNQSITIASPTDMTVGGSTQELVPTATSRLTVTLTSTTTGICTVAGFVITAVASGTCSITASQAGNANYEPAPDVIRTFASRATQTITFTDPADITYGTTPSSLSATSTSTLSVAFTSATSAVCTISGSTVTVLSVGTCTINANQAGNVNFEPASQVSQSFTIAKATPNLSIFANISKTVGDASFTLTAPTVANSLPGSFTYTSATTSTATISGATVTLGSAGTTVITATFTPTDTTNYNNATISLTLTLSVAAPTFTLSSSSETRTVNTAATGFTINSTGGAIASFTISATPAGMSFNTSTGALTGTPTTVASATAYTVTATNATGSTTQTFTLTVSRATQATLSITSLTTSTRAYPYSQALSITTSGGSGSGATTFAITSGGSASGCTLSNSTATATITATTTGTCLIQATKAADATYESTTSAAATFTFTKATQAITFTDPADITYGTSPSSLSATSTSTLTVAFTTETSGVCTVSGTTVTIVSAGTCTLNANQAGNANHEAASQVVQSFTIAKATQSISFTTPSAMTVGGSTQTVAPTASSSLTVTLTSTTTGTCTVAGFVITAVAPGTCSITASQAGNANYEAAPDVIRTFSITAVINIAAIAGVAAPVAGVTPVNTTTAGTGYTGTVSWSGSPSTFASGTIYTATITLAATSGYTLTGVSANFFTVAGATSVTHSANSGVITAVFPAAPTTISMRDISMRAPITGETPATTITNGLGYSGTISWTGSPSIFASATSYTATITLTPTSGYTLTGVSPNFFRVGVATVTHSANSGVITAVFPATDSTISVAAISGVTVPATGATPVNTTTAGTGYTGTVTWSGSPSTFSEGTIYTATIRLSATFGYTLSGVNANFFIVAGATSVTHSANSGVITATFPATAKLNQSITIASPTDMTVGGSTQELVPTATSRLTVTLTSTTTGICTVAGFVITAVASGTCSITASQAGNANYEAAPQVSKSFTIAKATQATLSITSLTTNTKAYPYSQALSISTSGGSGSGATTFSIASGGSASGCALSDPTATATISATTTGTCLIQATKAADSTYDATTSAAATFTFTKASQRLLFSTPADMTIGGSTLTDARVFPDDSLTVTLTSTTINICTVAGLTITAIAPGTCSITASQAGNENYVAAADVIRTFSIARTISTSAISGVTFPVAEGTPVTSVTATAQYTGTVTWSGSPVTFAPTTTYTATITLTPASGYTLSGVSANFFTVAGATSVTQSANSGVITVIFPATGVGAARAVAITTQPIGAVSGSALGTQPIIRLIDSGGNTVTAFTTRIVASISSGTGTLSGTTSIETVSGIARFTDLVITGTAGTFTLTFTAATLSNATSNNLTITTGPATKVVISRAPVGTQRKTAFTTQPQITIKDASNNTVTTSTAVITATVTSGYNPRSIIGSNTATAVSGVATFSDLGLDGYGGSNYTITFSADGLTVASTIISLTGINCDGKSFTCRLGDTGPGGGKVIYVASGTFTQIGATGAMCSNDCKYLEAAPDDELWNSKYKWSGITNSVTGATGTAIGTGYSNTWAIFNQPDNELSAAVARTINYRGPNSLTDWFLPSSDELYNLWFFNSFFGGFPGDKYWSSSEVTSFSSYAYNFTFNQLFYTWKYEPLYIRPVRAF